MEDSKRENYIEEFYLDCGFATRSLHAGEHVDQPNGSAHTAPIYQTSTFVFKDSKEGAQLFAGEKSGYIYTRLGNPTAKVLEAKINALEGADVKKQNPNLRVSTLAFSSGMSAIASTLLGILSHSDTLLLGNMVYGATEHLAFNVLNKFAIKCVEVDTCNLAEVEQKMRDNPTAKAIFFETPTNPSLKVSDIQKVSDIVKKINPKIKVIVDNTFATPYLQRPLELGADVVVHSTTKYICGHGTVVGGLMTTFHDDVKDAVYTIIKDIGGSPSPFDTWLVNLGLKTLPIRMEKHCDNALKIAKFLNKHPKVEKVYFPGLANDPFHDLAKKQMKNFGGIVSFELKGGYESGKKLMDSIEIFTLAVSLGSVDSLIQHPASMTHACVPKEKRFKAGINDGLVRVSVGIEDVSDLIKALEKGLLQV
ncbi:MAG: PLP-dependent transferase [Oligoflexia bacterium]|nr:PLP-dependent transferase [Oligoflexia bacterium]MBF0367671.1 PLP-dependent transferase [Oligoflexia bacterium]